MIANLRGVAAFVFSQRVITQDVEEWRTHSFALVTLLLSSGAIIDVIIAVALVSFLLKKRREAFSRCEPSRSHLARILSHHCTGLFQRSLSEPQPSQSVCNLQSWLSQTTLTFSKELAFLLGKGQLSRSILPKTDRMDSITATSVLVCVSAF